MSHALITAPTRFWQSYKRWRTKITNRRRVPLAVRIYSTFDRLLAKWHLVVNASFVGFWLGILGRETLNQIDGLYYEKAAQYRDDQYNLQGLYPWEEEVIQKYFLECNSVLVAAVGGGRELLALRNFAFTLDGFECNPVLVAYANTLLTTHGLGPLVQLIPRDECPHTAKAYDGIIVGWGAYALIQGRDTRIAFLRQLRSCVRTQSPLLLSFYDRVADDPRFPIVAAVGNALRTCLRRDRMTIGDYLAPFYVHFFTKDQIASELRDGGFELAHYSTDGYGHAVGMAC